MNKLKDVFEVIAQLENEKLIQGYAIGGALAALFYAEVSRTYDVDVFVLMDIAPDKIVSLEALYQWCKEKGFSYREEHLLIYDTPVQILVAGTKLQEDAIKNCNVLNYEGAQVKVMKPEFLVAMYLIAGGLKRKERASFLFEADVVDKQALGKVWKEYQLEWSLLPAEYQR